jgi:hypothetical protein
MRETFYLKLILRLKNLLKNRISKSQYLGLPVASDYQQYSPAGTNRNRCLLPVCVLFFGNRY